MSAIQTPPRLNIACRLVIDGKSIRVGQLSGKFLVIDEDVNVPPATSANLIVQVSGKRKVFPIFLPYGIQKDVEETLFY